LPGARALYGEHDGAGYQIEVPQAWNGSVVYFAHGFRGNPPQLTVGAPPMRDYLIERGFAWAASSYSKNGYEPGVAARDTLALREVFESEVGAPQRSYIYGQSMGGHVVSLSLEQYPDAYDGALSECGVVSGHEILDYFLSWGVLAGYLTGVELYDVTTDVGAFAVKVKDEIVPALGDPREPSAAGRAFISAIEHMTGGPRPFFMEGLLENYEFNFVILVNAVGAAGPANAASQNIGIEYEVADGLSVTSEQINREIARIEAQTQYRDIATYPEFAEMSGKIARPLLTLHNTGDLFVPISLEQSYARLVEGAGAGDLLVQRAIRRPGHCNFTEDERRRAFDDLVGWVEQGARPAGDDLSGDLREAGRAFTEPPTDGDPGGESTP
jgi:pimeloyl-ACP methyl ester carboxylesterase